MFNPALCLAYTASCATALRTRPDTPAGTFLTVIAACVMAMAPLAAKATTQAATAQALPTVMLVHGAWADGSSWNDVTARLQAKGVRVVSVQNPLSSLADDVSAVQRALEREAGPVVLVGHSWGGTVITQAGSHDKVAALVYVAAFAPETGQSTSDVQKGLVPGYVSLLQPDSSGYLWFPQDQLPELFAQDVSSATGRVLAAAQNPIRASAFDDKVAKAAWHDKPSWYLVTNDDRMIAPDLQREMAARIHARVHTVAASHVPFLSRPKETAAIILEAVHATLSP